MQQVNLKRLILACMATILSVLLFLKANYENLDAARPETLLSSLWNVCGILMLACIAWLWVEVVLLLLSPSQSEVESDENDLLSWADESHLPVSYGAVPYAGARELRFFAEQENRKRSNENRL
ncbi:hypothetical protein [Terriglobus sp. TAA 43]|uniref:hypothetical protein n=1 Tax=Terriglobus sp. TAA 43 TaxID=278961 RepID=UPI0012ED3389|nr:hypothetical protein [Terriglobus sp. TAA 43]